MAHDFWHNIIIAKLSENKLVNYIGYLKPPPMFSLIRV